MPDKLFDNEQWTCFEEDGEITCDRKIAPVQDGRVDPSVQNQVVIGEDGTVTMNGVDTRILDDPSKGVTVIDSPSVDGGTATVRR